MLTINFIRENTDLVVRKLKVKNFDAATLVDSILSADRQRREILTRTESLQAELNRISKEIGNLIKSGNGEKAAEMKELTQAMKEETKTLNADLARIETELKDLSG